VAGGVDPREPGDGGASGVDAKPLYYFPGVGPGENIGGGQTAHPAWCSVEVVSGTLMVCLLLNDFRSDQARAV
jgi:hypothetical protein